MLYDRVSVISYLQVSSTQTTEYCGSCHLTNVALASGGITHCCCRRGLRRFFSVRPIVLSLARSTIFSLTTCSSSSCSVHHLRPFGGSEPTNATVWPRRRRQIARSGRAWGMLADERGIEALFHQALGYVCRRLTVRFWSHFKCCETRRPNGPTMAVVGAAAAAGEAPDGATERGPPAGSEWHFVDPSHGCALA
jgi:hypothetical protein